MTYCKNCGVGLSKTESVCPLCQVRVASSAQYSAYPAVTEKVPAGIKSNLSLSLLGIMPAVQIVFERLVLMISEIKN